MTRICPHCNSEIDLEQKLCPVCFFGEGLKQDTVACTKCETELDPAARFCSECGTMTSQSLAAEGDPIQAALVEKLGSQYRIVRLLGRGGMGSVYLARDLTLDREVAIKVVNTADGSLAIYDRFRREAKTAAKLSHPNIVPLHSFGEVAGMPYFVMGYVRGESLADRMRREGRMSEEETRCIFAEIADALDHAHRQGVIHRDIKPDNVLLDDESGRALLTDFGVAKALGQEETLTKSGTVIGTPQYMSPEQASGQTGIDGRSDIYSLGVMAYAMVSGRLPFEGASAGDVLVKHLTQEPTPLRSVAPEVSDSTAHAIELCLAKNPAERWQDARSLKATLGASEEDELPPPLQAVEGVGISLLLLLIGFEWFAWLVDGLTGASSHPDMRAIYFSWWWYGMAPLLFGGFYVYLSTKLWVDGFAGSRSQGVLWREPTWWPTWYPRSLRRPGNVWDRLPAAIRIYRVWPLVIIIYTVITIGTSELAGVSVVLHRNPFMVSIVAVLCVLIAVWFVVGARARKILRNEGIAAGDISRALMTSPPSRKRFWNHPSIASILEPAEGKESIRRSSSPHDDMQSILREADKLSGALRPLGAQAAVAARQLVASIDQIDREIADLARNIEPGEEERLADKIDALSASSTSAEASAPMRSLLEKHLELVRSLSGRIEEATQRRGRRVEMLRTLALHVASLHSRQSTTPSELREISDNVRALCDEIQHRTLMIATAAVAPGDDDATIERS